MRRFLLTVDAVSYNVRVDFDLFDDNFPYNSDLSEILTEIRGMRIEMQKRAEAMGRLEKRVRKMLEDATYA